MSWVWGGSPTHTLSPALFSHPLFSAQCPGYALFPRPSPNPTSRGRIISFPIEAISRFNALPLQAHQGLLFLFLPFLRLSALSLPCEEGVIFRSSRFSAVPEFVHICPTRPQQGGKPVFLVSLPYPGLKIANRATQGRIGVFSPERTYPSP